MSTHGTPSDTRSFTPAIWNYLAGLKGDDLVAWRTAEVPNRPSADERNLPHEFPFGWFVVHYSDELLAGQVKPIRYFGQDLALWRGHDGVARVIDAYCAHYGANMAVGGKVDGNNLECPFHAWRYNGDGAVEEIPYSKIIPPQARRKDCVPSWPTQEANGFVWVWYHPERVAPLWDLYVVPEIGRDDWTPYTKLNWTVFSSLENMADNGIDVSHFKFVHGAPSIPEYEISYDKIRRLVRANIAFVTPRGEVNGVIDSITHGPGQGIIRFTGLSETLLISGVTPVERDRLDVRFAFTQPKSAVDGPMSGLSRGLIKEICNQLDQDKIILDRHRVMQPPLVCVGDGPFHRNRMYYSQFFASTNPSGKIAA